MKLINKTKNRILAENVETADTFLKRMKGLLGRDSIPQGYGLHIIPCNNIHSFFMNFKFDAIFIDKKNIIRTIVKNMPPARIKISLSSYSVIELSGNTINITDTQIGDEIIFIK